MEILLDIKDSNNEMEKIKWLSSLPPKYTQKILNDMKINNTELH